MGGRSSKSAAGCPECPPCEGDTSFYEGVPGAVGMRGDGNSITVLHGKQGGGRRRTRTRDRGRRSKKRKTARSNK